MGEWLLIVLSTGKDHMVMSRISTPCKRDKIFITIICISLESETVYSCYSQSEQTSKGENLIYQTRRTEGNYGIKLFGKKRMQLKVSTTNLYPFLHRSTVSCPVHVCDVITFICSYHCILTLYNVYNSAQPPGDILVL